MMKIGSPGQGSNSMGAAMMPGGSDAVSKDIQRQIEETKKQLQELSENQKLSSEEKMKKRQELQKQLTELNNQLRQHEIEQRREKQQKKQQGSAMEELLGGSPKAAKSGQRTKAGMSTSGMKALISADTAMEQAQSQGSVATSLNGRAGVLEAEIKQDGSRGADVSAKKEELAEVEQRAVEATASQGQILGEASQEMKEAAKAEQTEANASKETKKSEPDKNTENGKETESAGEEALPGNYVDIRL